MYLVIFGGKRDVDFNIEKAFSGEVTSNVLLKRNDEITIYSVLDFKEDFKVVISGEVKNPGDYDFHDNLSLNDILIQAGGIKGSASSTIEIARMIKTDVINSKVTERIELFTVNITPQSNEQATIFMLQPFDVINVRKMAVYNVPEQVTIAGAVVHAGKYVLTSNRDKISSVIARAGGLIPLADLEGIKVKRPLKANEIEEIESIDLNLGKNDSVHNKIIKKAIIDSKFVVIPIDWHKVMKDENSYDNITLQGGDEIVINSESESVKVSGNVLLTSEIPYIKGKSMKYYLNSAGGLDAKGWKRKSYVIYPNGRADVASHFLFFNNFPTITPGSQIVVPEKPATKKMTTAEIVSVGSVFVSIAGIISTFLLLNR